MTRLEVALNKPRVVLVVGVVAVAVNILFYFGYYLPRTAPLIEEIPSISKAVPEAVSQSFTEAILVVPSDPSPESPTPHKQQSPPQQLSPPPQFSPPAQTSPQMSPSPQSSPSPQASPQSSPSPQPPQQSPLPSASPESPLPASPLPPTPQQSPPAHQQYQ